MQKLIVNANEYFLEAVTSAAHKYPLKHASLVKPYLASLLSKFLLSENLFVTEEQQLRNPTLAFLLKEAIEAPLNEQKPKYQHLGDVALYISAVFPASLNKSLVGVDYYIQMGSSAYAQTADLSPKSKIVFNTLADEFTKVMDLLAEATEITPTNEDQVLQLYELFMITKSPRILAKLNQLGIHPINSLGHKSQ
jgi:hypothetical protein